MSGREERAIINMQVTRISLSSIPRNLKIRINGESKSNERPACPSLYILSLLPKSYLNTILETNITFALTE